MITIYGAEYCSWCKKAKDLAEQYQLPFEYKDVGADADFKCELKNRIDVSKLSEGRLTIPQIWWNDQYIGGYEAFASAVENTIGNYGQGPC